MSKTIKINPNDIFGSTHSMVSYADHFSQEEYEQIEGIYRSMSQIQDPGLSMAIFESLLYEEHFEPLVCPNCGQPGLFKWLVLGYHKHPECGHRWIESPWENIKRLFGPTKFEVKATNLLSSLLLPLQFIVYYAGGRSSSKNSDADGTSTQSSTDEGS